MSRAAADRHDASRIRTRSRQPWDFPTHVSQDGLDDRRAHVRGQRHLRAVRERAARIRRRQGLTMRTSPLSRAAITAAALAAAALGAALGLGRLHEGRGRRRGRRRPRARRARAARTGGRRRRALARRGLRARPVDVLRPQLRRAALQPARADQRRRTSASSGSPGTPTSPLNRGQEATPLFVDGVLYLDLVVEQRVRVRREDRPAALALRPASAARVGRERLLRRRESRRRRVERQDLSSARSTAGSSRSTRRRATRSGAWTRSTARSATRSRARRAS